MNEFRADLHCHTTCSDGTVSPEDIVLLAIKRNLSGLAITDHDSIHAYPIALPIARKLQFPLISGVEFSSMHNNKNVHLLGYSFSLTSTAIHDFCERHHRRRTMRNNAILEKLAKHGMAISEDELGESPTLGRPHIAMALMKKGYVTSLQEAFHKYIGDGKPCYAPGGYFSVEETIDIIHQAGGFAVIAHPHLIQEPNLVNELLDMPFDGIEGYYGRFPADQQERWVKMGEKRGWLVTGGSDFHGDIKPMQPLGSSWVGEETFRRLEARFKDNNKES